MRSCSRAYRSGSVYTQYGTRVGPSGGQLRSRSRTCPSAMENITPADRSDLRAVAVKEGGALSAKQKSVAPRYPLASVDHALRILERLQLEPSLRLSDIARDFRIANSTAHRLLATLSHRGFVEQEAGT